MSRFNQSSAALLKSAIDSGITSTEELVSLMANASVETANFSTMHERFNYSKVENLVRAVSSATTRYTYEQVQDAIDSRDPEKIATVMYEGRNTGQGGLGNSEEGDGWRFHGRGYFQFTGRSNYETYGKKFGIDLTNNPELAADPETSSRLALAFWKERVIPEELRSDVVAAGFLINGGMNGKELRLAAARSWSAIITPDLVRDIETGALSVTQLAAMETQEHAKELHGRQLATHQLQQSLNRLGYKDSQGHALTPDGDYGRNTRLAVEAFQRKHDLVADGIAGPLTLAAVSQAVKTELRSIGQQDAAYLRTEQPNEALSAYQILAPEPELTRPVLPVAATSPQVPKVDVSEATTPQRPDTEAIRKLQENLNTLGITDVRDRSLAVDGIYGMDTQTAVARFQGSRGLLVTGQTDEATRSMVEGQAFIAYMQRVASPAASWEAPNWEAPQPSMPGRAAPMQAAPRSFSGSELAPPTHSLDDPRHPDSPNHTLYNELQHCVPDASENRLLQFTAACHKNMITADNLSTVYLDEDKMTLDFRGSDPLATPAQVDLSTPPPKPHEAIQQIQQFDQQEMQLSQTYQIQNAQVSHSGPSR